MKRRTLILAAGSSAFLLGGITLGSWRNQRELANMQVVQAAKAKQGAVAVLQAAQLVDLDGTPMTLPVGKRFLLNFWATWCPPCLHEIPLLDAAYDEQLLPVVGLAVDNLETVNEFLQVKSFSYPVAVAGLNNGITLLEQLGNTSAAMPFSVVVEASGELGTDKIGPFVSTDEIKEFFVPIAG